MQGNLDQWFAREASSKMYDKIKESLKELELNVLTHIYDYYSSIDWSTKRNDHIAASASYIHQVQSRWIFPTVDSYDEFREQIMPINTWHPRITRMVNELGLIARVETGDDVLGNGTGILLTKKGLDFCEDQNLTIFGNVDTKEYS